MICTHLTEALRLCLPQHCIPELRRRIHCSRGSTTDTRSMCGLAGNNLICQIICQKKLGHDFQCPSTEVRCPQVDRCFC